MGEVVAVEDFPEAREPAYKLEIDFGPELGRLRSSAKLTHYSREQLQGRQVICVTGFPPLRVAGFKSEVLVLGALNRDHGVVLLAPDREVSPGDEIA